MQTSFPLHKSPSLASLNQAEPSMMLTNVKEGQLLLTKNQATDRIDLQEQSTPSDPILFPGCAALNPALVLPRPNMLVGSGSQGLEVCPYFFPQGQDLLSYSPGWAVQRYLPDIFAWNTPFQDVMLCESTAATLTDGSKRFENDCFEGIEADSVK